MQPLDDAILSLLKASVIDSEQAYNKAVNKSKFRDYLPEPPQDFTEV
jgi:twitching motility protein PilT